MTKGSPEWVRQTAEQMIADAEPKLIQISEQAAQRHRIGDINLSVKDTINLASYLGEVEDQSFKLGVEMAMALLKKVSE